VKHHRLIAVLIFTASLNQARPADNPVSTTKKSTTVKPHPTVGSTAQSDTALEKSIRARFAESKIASDKFEVHVQSGRATLTGNTDVLQHKGVATRLARAEGATDVVNNIEPSDQARQKAVANLTSGRRRAQIKRGDARSDAR
jgi:osmotically-inducible protein OsmY